MRASDPRSCAYPPTAESKDNNYITSNPWTLLAGTAESSAPNLPFWYAASFLLTTLERLYRWGLPFSQILSAWVVATLVMSISSPALFLPKILILVSYQLIDVLLSKLIAYVAGHCEIAANVDQVKATRDRLVLVVICLTATFNCWKTLTILDNKSAAAFKLHASRLSPGHH